MTAYGMIFMKRNQWFPWKKNNKFLEQNESTGKFKIISILISVINVELCIAKDSAPKVISRESVLLRVSAVLTAMVKFYYRLFCDGQVQYFNVEHWSFVYIDMESDKNQWNGCLAELL